MALGPNQPKTGHLDEESVNPTRRTGRDDGTEGGQKTTGHLDGESGPVTKSNRPVPTETQGVTFRGDESTNKKGSPAATPQRVDEVKEIG